MKQSKPSKVIINQLVATTLISSFLLTTACNNSGATKHKIIIEEHRKEMKEQLAKVQANILEKQKQLAKTPANTLGIEELTKMQEELTKMQEELTKMQEDLSKVQKAQGKLAKTQEQEQEREQLEKMQEQLAKMQEDLSKAQKAQNNSVEEENFKETQAKLVTTKEIRETKNTQDGNDQLTESKSFTSVIKIGLSPKYTNPHKIFFRIDNITDSKGDITDDVQASFIDITDSKGNIEEVNPFNDIDASIGLEVEVNEKTRQVRLNITCVKDLFNSDDDSSRKKEFIINLTAYSPHNKPNRIVQKISIPLSIGNTSMAIGTHTTNGQPCDNISIDDWDYDDETKEVIVDAQVVGGVLVESTAVGLAGWYSNTKLHKKQNHGVTQRSNIRRITMMFPKGPQKPKRPGFGEKIITLFTTKKGSAGSMVPKTPGLLVRVEAPQNLKQPVEQDLNQVADNRDKDLPSHTRVVIVQPDPIVKEKPVVPEQPPVGVVQKTDPIVEKKPVVQPHVDKQPLIAPEPVVPVVPEQPPVGVVQSDPIVEKKPVVQPPVDKQPLIAPEPVVPVVPEQPPVGVVQSDPIVEECNTDEARQKRIDDMNRGAHQLAAEERADAEKQIRDKRDKFNRCRADWEQRLKTLQAKFSERDNGVKKDREGLLNDFAELKSKSEKEEESIRQKYKQGVEECDNKQNAIDLERAQVQDTYNDAMNDINEEEQAAELEYNTKLSDTATFEAFFK